MSSVEINGLQKSFGGHNVLKDINLNIPSGSFVVLVGPSGCGKSTLLRMIAGLEDISGGSINIDRRRVDNLEPKERDIAMVFQSYALYPHMSVADNIGFPLRMRKAAAEKIRSAVDGAGTMLGLKPLLERRPRQLSGGQRQRVAMGRSMVRSPRVFLFDEPLSNLDAQLRVQMRGEIRELQQQLGVTTIYVTHDQTEAMSMGDVIVVMRDGHIEQSGNPIEIYDRPGNIFVAQFIGSPSMNILPGTLRNGEFHDATGAPTGIRAKGEGQISLGFRPQAVSLSSDGGLAMKVGHVEELGAETHIVGTVAGERVVVVSRDRQRIRRDDIIYLRPDPEKLHIFGADGNRID